ncbi:hypothetical protein JGH11_14865, partial [Dysgonomonas sp. Marseille-P4677]|uniref:hypothetical protein n=1 Tax=Dysgonomonas sp. Marseille-P4677 TaxID=2364790 RepID=UPI001914BD7C
VDRRPSNYRQVVNFDFTLNHIINLKNVSTYSGLFTIAPWRDQTGSTNCQLAYRLGHKGGTYEDKWLSWNKLVIGDNCNDKTIKLFILSL